MLAPEWGGRVDIDLVVLYTTHRATFEQLARVLSSWHLRRIQGALARRRHDLTEQMYALRAADRAAARAMEESDIPTFPPLEAQEQTSPGVARLARIVNDFNSSEQTREDMEAAIRALEQALQEHRDEISSSAAAQAEEMIETLQSLL